MWRLPVHITFLRMQHATSFAMDIWLRTSPKQSRKMLFTLNLIEKLAVKSVMSYEHSNLGRWIFVV